MIYHVAKPQSRSHQSKSNWQPLPFGRLGWKLNKKKKCDFSRKKRTIRFLWKISSLCQNAWIRDSRDIRHGFRMTAPRGVFFSFKPRKDHENDLEMTRLKVNCKDNARKKKDKSLTEKDKTRWLSRQMENDDGNLLENDRRGNRLPSLIRIRRILPPYHAWIFETFVWRVYQAWLDFITFRIVMDSVRNNSRFRDWIIGLRGWSFIQVVYIVCFYASFSINDIQ